MMNADRDAVTHRYVIHGYGNSINVQARLAQEGLTPSPEAPAATLIRRVTLDLTGRKATDTPDQARSAFDALFGKKK